MMYKENIMITIVRRIMMIYDDDNDKNDNNNSIDSGNHTNKIHYMCVVSLHSLDGLWLPWTSPDRSWFLRV